MNFLSPADRAIFQDEAERNARVLTAAAMAARLPAASGRPDTRRDLWDIEATPLDGPSMILQFGPSR